MQQELDDKSLPEGKTTQAVAGYLYFPKPSGRAKIAAFDLTYCGAAGQVKRRVSAPAKLRSFALGKFHALCNEHSHFDLAGLRQLFILRRTGDSPHLTAA